MSKSDLADWPLIPDSGVLKCQGSGGMGKVTIEVDGKSYAVNGLAKQDKGNLDIAPIWAPDGSTGLKKDISGLVDEGLKLCR